MMLELLPDEILLIILKNLVTDEKAAGALSLWRIRATCKRLHCLVDYLSANEKIAGHLCRKAMPKWVNYEDILM